MRRTALLLFVMLVTPVGSPWAGTGKDDASEAARRFGSALTSASSSSLKPLLPVRGTVHLALKRLAQEEGSFGSSQVEAVFHDALSRVVVRSYEVIRIECDGQTMAVVRGRAGLTDAQGRSGQVSLHLSFQPEDGRWVIREIKENVE